MNLSINPSRFVAFRGLEKKQMPNNNNESVSAYTERALNTMKERAELEVPEYGNFKSVVHIFDIPDTLNEAVFTIKPVETPKKVQRILTIGTKRLGSDREFSYMIKEGTKEEILKTLNEMKVKDTVKKLAELSDKSDTYYSQYI